jgi:hypothetical protein
MTATIGGVADTFHVDTPDSYIGLRVFAKSRANHLQLALADAAIGVHTWGMDSPDQFHTGTGAVLNGFPALLGSGGFEINQHDYSNRRINGTFTFSVYDTLKRDTVRVTDGRFTIYYITSD